MGGGGGASLAKQPVWELTCRAYNVAFVGPTDNRDEQKEFPLFKMRAQYQQ
jgi:hypothetical protein